MQGLGHWVKSSFKGNSRSEDEKETEQCWRKYKESKRKTKTVLKSDTKDRDIGWPLFKSARQSGDVKDFLFYCSIVQ